jgi:LuxR family maltose regulon positive regulatory protein
VTTALASRAAKTASSRPWLRAVGSAVVAPSAPELGFVPRPDLVRALRADTPLAIVVAPPGYGKSTLLADWQANDPRPFARAVLGAADNDPAHLRETVARGLAPLPPGPFVLALDDVHALHEPAALAELRGVLDGLPAGAKLALAARSEPSLPIGRLRAHRALTELRARDLVMSAAEAADLLAAAGVTLAAPNVEALVRRTEGWPAGLYLAALALREQAGAGAGPANGVARFAGDDRFVADYFRDEVLAALSDAEVTFLRRAAVLDVLSGPVCDAVLERGGSARLLRSLSRAGTMLVALDHAEERFRLHGLFAETLRAELQRIEPELVRGLHRRASEWHDAHGDSERAIHHAVAGADPGRAGNLLLASAPAYVSRGRNGTMQRWLRGFSDGEIAAHPPLAIAAAHSHLARGELGSVQRWETAARRVLEATPSAGRDPAHDAGVALLRAARAPDGLRQMARDATLAFGLEPDDSPWRAFSCLLLGVAEHLTGERGTAERLLADGVRRASVAAPHVQALCLAQLALMAAERDDWESGAAFVERAVAQVEHYRLARYPTSALVLAASSVIRVRRGRVEEAREDLRQATRLLAMLTDFIPWYETETRLALARTTLRIGDVAGARELLDAAERRARQVPDGLVLHQWIDEVRAEAQAASTAAVAGRPSLTTAELRILAFLPTHLSFREIAGRLFVSANTVKTQAHAVYRKLDASSRSEAVARATAQGLLDAQRTA